MVQHRICLVVYPKQALYFVVWLCIQNKLFTSLESGLSWDYSTMVFLFILGSGDSPQPLSWTTVALKFIWLQYFLDQHFICVQLIFFHAWSHDLMILISWFLASDRIWLLTWCKSAPLFSNCPDFLQIEIYYIKKRKFWSCTNISGFWTLDLGFRRKSVADVWIICPTIYKLGGLPTDWNLLY